MKKLDLQFLTQLEEEFSSSASPGNLHWKSHASTHLGNVRFLNEDAFFESNEKRLWAVADGMGGHSKGDYASKSVVYALKQFVRKEAVSENIADLEKRLIEVNGLCRNAFKGKRVGTTVAMLFESSGHCFFVWAGDSRIYRLRQGKLEQITTDHSLAQEKYARGELSLEESISDPSAHVLTRAIGAHRQLNLDILHSKALAGDRYLICSDGLYNLVDFLEIQSILLQEDLELAVNQLQALALKKGGNDNVTTVAIEAIGL